MNVGWLKHSYLIAGCFATAILVTGCSSTPTEITKTPTTFLEPPWDPPTEPRAPAGARPIDVDTFKALQAGVYGFSGAERTGIQLVHAKHGQGKQQTLKEILTRTGERPFNWGTGSHVFYRNGVAVTNKAPIEFHSMYKDRARFLITGKSSYTFDVHLAAYDVSGLPIRDFVRNQHDRPDRLAFFVSESARFPTGSVMYLPTYWLSQDELVRPSQKSFTGSRTLEAFIEQFSKDTPYCLSYIRHRYASPLGVRFDRHSRGNRGQYWLIPTNKDSVFCQATPDNELHRSTWERRKIQGTSVLVLNKSSSVSSTDLGIVPVHKQSIDVGFAEIITAKKQRQVVPVRILYKNKPLTDFRLKFNKTAADAMSHVLQNAQQARNEYDAQRKARYKNASK